MKILKAIWKFIRFAPYTILGTPTLYTICLVSCYCIDASIGIPIDECGIRDIGSLLGLLLCVAYIMVVLDGITWCCKQTWEKKD